MVKFVTLISLSLFILVSTSVFAQDQALLNKVLASLKLKTKDVNTELVVTKILPYDKQKTVLVIPKYVTNDPDDSFFIYDAYIVIANNKTGEIVNKYYESEKWTSDAIVLDELTIDSGLYKLNEQTRAFGVRASFTGSSRVNPYSNTTLSLYIPSKNKLSEIANAITVYNYYGEWDGNCNGEFQNEEITIDLDKEKTNGFYNLILTNKTTETKNKLKGEDCLENVSKKNEKFKLKFNGTIYK